jgi:ankyrin repeat protein
MVDEKACSVDGFCVNYACRSGSLEAVRYLLTIVRDQFSENALVFAAAYGHLEVMKLLCQEFEFPHYKALTMALTTRQAGIVGYLLSLGQEKTVDASYLQKSVAGGDYETVRISMKYGAMNLEKETVPLLAGAGELTILQKLLVEQPSLFDESALFEACLVGNLAIVKLLHESRPDLQPTGRCVDVACEHKHFGILRYLVERMNAKPTTESLTLAVPHFEMVRYLHTKAKAPCNNNAIFYRAVSDSCLDIVKYLRDHYPDIQCGELEFSSAACTGDFEMLQYLHSTYPSQTSVTFMESSAIDHQNLEMLEFMLKNRMATPARALQAAARNGEWEFFKTVYDTIIKMGPVPSAAQDVASLETSIINWNPIDKEVLTQASYGGNLDIVQFVHKHVADGTANPDYIVSAARTGSLPLVQFLCTNRTDFGTVMAPRFTGLSFAFCHACAANHMDVARYLYEKFGADCDIGQAFSGACFTGAPEAVRFLAPLVSDKGILDALEVIERPPWLKEVIGSRVLDWDNLKVVDR